MKRIVVLFAPSSSRYMFEKQFDGFSAFEKSLEWASSICEDSNVYIFTDSKNTSLCSKNILKDDVKIEIIEKDSWNVFELLQNISSLCKSNNADFAVYAWADCPFLNTELTNELLQTHQEYLAEYTFADGYPYGFSPEIIDGGAAAIMATLSVKPENPSANGNELVKRDSIWSVMKSDINSFEIETVLAKTDWRIYRLNFHCGTKEYFIASKKLFEIAKDESSAEVLSKKAVECTQILRTVPGFYNIQIEPSYRSECLYSPYPVAIEKSKTKFERMSVESYKSLVKQIAELSENAVVSFSLWGEAIYHPELVEFVKETLKYSGLSVFIETTGDKLSENLVKQIADVANNAESRTNGYESVMWVVLLDAMTKDKYKEIHFVDGFESAVLAVKTLQNYFPKSTYPQFVRMQQNEDQLEAFYRYWNDKTSPSQGKLIIQKYNSYGGLLPDYKVADIAPVERFPDWHLRRDMVILCNGNVPVYKESMLEDCVGNVFSESLESVWRKSDHLMGDQINKKYDEISWKCDEYYTFNF